MGIEELPIIESLDRNALTDAVADADLRVLLMCVFHLSGDRRWLEEPFRPSRDNQLIANESAGFGAELADEIRRAAIDLLTVGTIRPVIDDPGDALMVEMMRWCMHEEIDAAYAPMMREDMAFTDRDVKWRHEPHSRGRHVVIVGAGASGLILGARLRRLGIDFTILERADKVGGTWRDNTYPGAGVDTPNHAYSFSLGSRRAWSRYFSPQPELLSYLQCSADEFGIREQIRFGADVRSCRWDDVTGTWRVEIASASGREIVVGSDLVAAIGQFGIPSVPDLPGRDQFDGPIFHTTAWPDDLDVVGKRVAIIGTGASAMQIVPSIVDDVERLTIYQRSPQWARPIDRYHEQISDGTQWLLAHVPYYARWFRFAMLWRYGDGLLPFLRKDPEWPHPDRSLNRVNEKHRQEMVDHIKRELGDRTDLLDSCISSYPPYGKRILLDNGWYRALRRSSVELVTGGVGRITQHGVVGGDGAERPADIVVLSTGFKMTEMARSIRPVGRDGRTLDDVWGDDDATAHLGITIPGFPNFF